MELMEKQGFKQTEVGLIPEDWEVISIYEAIKNTQLGGNYKNTENETDYPLMKMGNLDRGFFKFNKIEYVVGQKPDERDLLKYGDVIFNTRNTLDLVGKVAVWKNELDKAYFNSNLFRFEFNENKISSSFFFNYLINTKRNISQLRAIATGTTSVAAIYTRDLTKVKIAIPTLEEQKAIATALSDVDELITNLDKLITKKKAIKQGAMQQLLTPPHKGGKRLEGFSGDWVEKVIGKIGNTFGGLSGKTKTDFENGKYPYITFLNVMNNTIIDSTIFEYVNIKSGEQQNKARKGDLFFNTSSETPEEVGMCAILKEEVKDLYLNSFCFGFRLKEDSDIDGLLFSYLINSPIGRNLFLSLAQGATRYNLSKSNFNKLIIEVPPLKEQKAIAQILFDIDEEIKKLESKKSKCQSVKQGMMQELLTGKTRLI